MTVEERIDDPEVPSEETEAEEAPQAPLSTQARVMRILVAGSLIVIAATAAIFAVADRQADDQLILHVTHPRSISGLAVERSIASAPEPTINGPGKAKVVRATCQRGSGGTIGNPWSCLVRYSNGRALRYELIIDQRGHFDAATRARKGRPPYRAEGCCLRIPSAG
jgi:hypothetical protein